MKKQNMIFLFFVLMHIQIINTCFTTLINDSNHKIRVYDKNYNTIIDIPQKGKRRFGQSKAHAYFSIHIPQQKSDVFNEVYICKQNQCGRKGNIVLKISDIENNSGETYLFTIHKKTSYPSMLHELPMIKEEGCHSCSKVAAN